MTFYDPPSRKTGAPPSPSSWLEKLRHYSIVVAISFAVSVVVAGADAAKKIHETLQLFGFARLEALELAESTAKSNFSDRLVRAALMRMYWAEVYATRIKNGGRKDDIDMAWRNYAETSSQWNADLFVNVAGLRRFYNAQKSKFFEDDIHGNMKALDRDISQLRRNQDDELQSKEELAEKIFTATRNISWRMGIFALCTEPLGSTGADSRGMGCSIIKAKP